MFINLSTLVGLLLPALVITRVVDGPDALRALLRSSFAWRVVARAGVTMPAAMPVVTNTSKNSAMASSATSWSIGAGSPPIVRLRPQRQRRR